MALAMLILCWVRAGAEDSATVPDPAAASAGADAALLLHDGRVVSGTPALSAGQLGMREDAHDQVALERLIGLEAPGPVPTWIDQGVILVDGEIIRGRVRAIEQGQLTLVGDLAGQMTVSIAEVAGVVCNPTVLATLPAACAETPGVVLVNGDRLAGSVTGLAPEALVIDAGRRTKQLPRSRVCLAILRPTAPPGASHQCLRLANGDLVLGALTVLRDQRFGFHGQHGSLTLPAGWLRAAWSEGGPLTALDRPTPTASSAAPEGDGPPDSASAIDRSSPVTVAGRRWERALACHGATTMSFGLEGTESVFVAEAVRGPDQGLVVMQVLVDGVAAFDSGPLADGARPMPLCVRLHGARSLTLVTRAAAGSAFGVGSALWAWPTLER